MSWQRAADILALFMVSGYSTIPLFWLMLHPFVKSWRKRGRHAYWILLPIWAALILGIFVPLLRFRSFKAYSTPWAWIPGAFLLFLGVVVFRRAQANFSGVQISGLAELEPDRHGQELVFTGIRSRIRHPVYLAHVCEMLGWSIGSGLLAAFFLLLPTLALGALMIHSEERELVDRFGDSYRSYRRQVPAIVPKISP